MTSIYSPFNDGLGLVDPIYFVGQQDLFQIFSTNFLESISDHPKFFLISGQPLVGKSSFLRYFRYYVENNFNFLQCDCSFNNENINDIDYIIEKLISELLHNLKRSYPWGDVPISYNTIIENLSNYILENNGINIKLKKSFLNEVKDNFAEFLYNFYNEIDQEGIYIEIDTFDLLEDIEDVSKFSQWVSTIIHDLKNKNLKFPIVFTFALPKHNTNQFLDSSSILKSEVVFGEVKRLSDEDVRKYLNDGFNRVNWEISEEIMDFLVDASSGHPSIMNEYGSDVFWQCRNSSQNHNSEEKRVKAVGDSPRNIVDSKEMVLDAICSDLDDRHFLNAIKLSDNEKINRTCCLILNKLSNLFKDNFDNDFYFKKETILELLNEDEILIFDNFWSRLLDQNIIKFYEKNEKYYFMGYPFLLQFKIWSRNYDEEKVKERISKHEFIDEFFLQQN